ncbi:hypothetical protein [Rothia sp. ZJ1223]|uniref:hypothetical protein n=1 Tax=Rothia sp. ZJ1223 TaxID=2811098 RepID=UPI00195747F3|nr:hypothetical protein [Rothia sp. ZJ1223]MBM7051654.1 hypothetical protein [Rothia sp. ZJ1223]
MLTHNMAVSPNYLSAFTEIDRQTVEEISDMASADSTVVALIPSEHASAEDQIRSSVQSWVSFQNNPEEPENSDISVKVASDINTGIIPLLYFSTDTQMYIKNPILVVVDSTNNVLPPSSVRTLKTVYRAPAYQAAVSENNLDLAVIGFESLSQYT